MFLILLFAFLFSELLRMYTSAERYRILRTQYFLHESFKIYSFMSSSKISGETLFETSCIKKNSRFHNKTWTYKNIETKTDLTEKFLIVFP